MDASRTLSIALALAVLAAGPSTAAAQSPPRVPLPRLAEPDEPARVRPLDAPSDVQAPRLPTPFALAELAHPRIDASLSWTLGTIVSRVPGGGASGVGMVRAAGEAHVLLFRRFYIGAALPVALGRPGDGAREATDDASRRGAPGNVVAGNLEVQARIVFPMPSWLAAGASFGLGLPTATFDRNGPAQATARAAAALAPTDVALFLPGRLTYRPALDLRLLRGPFVLQLRQGLDVVQDVGEGGATLRGRLLAHAGVLLSRDLALVLEAQQLVRFDPDPDVPSDRRRSAVVIGPGARVSVGRFDLGGTLLASLGNALGVEMESLLAAQASVVAHLP